MGVTFIALGLLACAWAVLLLPDLRNRGGSGRRTDSVKSFRDQLSGLDRSRPSGVGVRPAGRRVTPSVGDPRRGGPVGRPMSSSSATRPGASLGPVRAMHAPLGAPGAGQSPFLPRSAAEAAQRRLLVLAVLAGLAVLTFLGGLVFGRPVFVVHLMIDATLAGYAYLLWERAARARSRQSSLVTLSRVDDTDDDVVLRREASGS